ncbi:pyrazinamidase/nicotinamidase-like protein [Tothia fuscella]|uniref:nicotinamidase n=1 Tax=Tothia fuscella TaxID=1048955 RepID=A0A9P4NLD0_9PEZI|nr:pyrazinamidase/nicotinamidase-like protein [Tothia fuscella]
MANDFKPALVVVDFQEDFCPPNGSLAVKDGRTIAKVINNLLSLPFVLKVATKDYHPSDHISFAPNHPPPHNIPFTSKITIKNPYNPTETQSTLLWPVHCVQGTPGSDLIPELDISKIDHVIGKGQDKRVEMYSAFADPFRSPPVSRSNLESLLRKAGVTHVFCVGLAMDYCVKFTAIDSAGAGFRTFVVEEGAKAVNPDAWGSVVEELKKAGVETVSVDGEEVENVKKLSV